MREADALTDALAITGAIAEPHRDADRGSDARAEPLAHVGADAIADGRTHTFADAAPDAGADTLANAEPHPAPRRMQPRRRVRGGCLLRSIAGARPVRGVRGGAVYQRGERVRRGGRQLSHRVRALSRGHVHW